MTKKIFIFGKTEEECMNFLRERNLDFERGKTVFVTNTSYRSVLGRLFERNDDIIILRGADEHLIDLVHSVASKSGIPLAGSK